MVTRTWVYGTIDHEHEEVVDFKPVYTYIRGTVEGILYSDPGDYLEPPASDVEIQWNTLEIEGDISCGDCYATMSAEGKNARDYLDRHAFDETDIEWEEIEPDYEEY